jgi:hypothetical protein
LIVAIDSILGGMGEIIGCHNEWQYRALQGNMKIKTRYSGGFQALVAPFCGAEGIIKFPTGKDFSHAGGIVGAIFTPDNTGRMVFFES